VSLVFERSVTGAAVHALVIGVGGYPSAKPGQSVHGANTPAELTNVKDLESAPVGAKHFADWLISHADGLPAPLASVELALSTPAGALPQAAEYDWKSRIVTLAGARDPRSSPTVSRATGSEVEAAGLRWEGRLRAQQNQFAVFYICGHGAAVPTRVVVFLSDLSGVVRSASPWEPFIDAEYLAVVMSRIPEIRAGYLFIDACQEVVNDIVLGEVDRSQGIGRGLHFFSQSRSPHSNKVLLLVPAPTGRLTFDNGDGLGGRFTLVLVEALDGAAACNYSGTGDWGVLVDGLPKAMKSLYQLRGWPSDGFDPTPIKNPLAYLPLVHYTAPPRVPFRIQLNPPYAISGATRVWLQDWAKSDILDRKSQSEVWTDWVTARMGLCYVSATFPPKGSGYQARSTPVDLSEMRVDPVVVHRVLP
jgi:hypothetical protein